VAVDDLAAEVLARALPGRAIRTYPAVLSTAADALAWARAGGPAGAVVVADYQASPRGRGGLEWRVAPGEGLCFSLVLRPELSIRDEGWTYVAASLGLSDALEAAPLEWPDTVVDRAALGVHTEAGHGGVQWAVVNAFVPGAPPPRAELLARVVSAVEARAGEPRTRVLAEYLRRCTTIGRRVTARVIPLGPNELRVTGVAATVKTDGSLVVETDDARRIAVLPHHLGFLEPERR
jgi:BirA family biotin operon repressor/biotin-[acetyl-CoA-carboxylase] ligase